MIIFSFVNSSKLTQIELKCTLKNKISAFLKSYYYVFEHMRSWIHNSIIVNSSLAIAPLTWLIKTEKLSNRFVIVSQIYSFWFIEWQYWITACFSKILKNLHPCTSGEIIQMDHWQLLLKLKLAMLCLYYIGSTRIMCIT